MPYVVFFVNLVLSWKIKLLQYLGKIKGIDLSITETQKKNTDIKTFTNMEIYGELFFFKMR